MTSSLTMSADEFAEAFGVGVDCVYACMDRGELPEIRLGRRRVIPRAAAERLLDQAMSGFDVDRLARALGRAS